MLVENPIEKEKRKGSERMKKLLSATLILVMVLSSLSFAFGTPNSWGFSDPSNLNKLQAYDKDSEKWENGHISGYKELEYVWFRYVSGDNTTTQYAIEFDYYESGRYGYDEVVEDIDFYTKAGASIDMSGKYDVDVHYPTVGSDPEVITLTVTITDTSGLPASYAMNFEARLAGPGQASQYPGGSLHARMAVGGNEEVSIDTPPYGTLDVTKTFVGGEPWEEVTIYFDGDGYDYQITLGASEWNGIIPNVEPGDYTVSENPVLSGWTADYDSQIVTITKSETRYVTVTNTYEPPVVTSGSLTIEKHWTDDVPETGYIDFEVEGIEGDLTAYAPGWSVTATELPLTTYTIIEETAFGLPDQSTYSKDGSLPIEVVLSETTPDATIVVTNHFNPPGSVMIHKSFQGAEPSSDTAIVFELWKADTPGYDGALVSSTTALYGETTWTALFDPVKPGLTYEIKEPALPEGWESHITPETFTLMPGEDKDVYVTNIYTPNITTGTITVYKSFEGYDGDPPVEDLLIDAAFTLYDSMGTTIGSFTPTITGGAWSGTFEDVPVGDWYYVLETYVDAPEGGGYWTTSVSPTAIYVAEGQNTDVYVTNTFHRNLPPPPEPTVDIIKAVEPGSHYTGGGPVTYTVTFTNTSELTVFSTVSFEDETSWAFDESKVQGFEAWFGDETTPKSILMSTDGGDVFGNPVDLSTYGGFEPGDVLTITYDYVSSGFGPGTYGNTVTGCAWMGGVYEQTDAVAPRISLPVCDSDSADFDVLRRSTPDDDDPGVIIEKTVEPEEASVGDAVTFTIEVTNNGDVSLTDVLVVDELIDVEWDIGTLGRGDSITETFEYVLEPGDFENGVFENIAEVTADSREGRASDTDDAAVDEETIDVPPVTPPAAPPEVIVPPAVPPQSLPQTGQAGTGVFYGLGSLLLVAGIGLGQKKRR